MKPLFSLSITITGSTILSAKHKLANYALYCNVYDQLFMSSYQRRLITTSCFKIISERRRDCKDMNCCVQIEINCIANLYRLKPSFSKYVVTS